MNGKKSVRSLTGVRRDSEVIYVGTYDTQPQHMGIRRGKISDVWGTLSKSQSTPDLLGERIYDEEEEDREEENLNVAKDTVFLQEPASIFNRPGFGSVAFRRAVSFNICIFLIIFTIVIRVIIISNYILSKIKAILNLKKL